MTSPALAGCTHPLRTSVPDFIAGLRELERDLITKDRIAEYMAAMTLRPEALHDYVWWRDSFYTRNFDLSGWAVPGGVTICGRRDRGPLIHTHNGRA